VFIDWTHQFIFSFEFPSTKNKKNIDTKQGPLIVGKEKNQHSCATTKTKKRTKAETQYQH
jgi:hypothetical protein